MNSIGVNSPVIIRFGMADDKVDETLAVRRMLRDAGMYQCRHPEQIGLMPNFVEEACRLIQSSVSLQAWIQTTRSAGVPGNG